MSNEYLAHYKKQQSDYIKLADFQDKELATLYDSAADDIGARAEFIIRNNDLSYSQAKKQIEPLVKKVDILSADYKNLIYDSLDKVAAVGIEPAALIMGLYQSSLAKQGIKIGLDKTLKDIPQAAVKATFNKIWPDGLKLSDNLWLTDRRSRQEIERIIMQNIASGGSASNKATISALDNLLRPDYKKAKLTSLHGRKVSYESSRLLRTTMSEAFNESSRLSANANPGVSGQTWLVNPGACPEICIPNSGANVKDVGYPPGHPNCMCSTLDIVMSIEKFTDKWIDFMDNPEKYPDLQDWMMNVYRPVTQGKNWTMM